MIKMYKSSFKKIQKMFNQQRNIFLKIKIRIFKNSAKKISFLLAEFIFLFFATFKTNPT